MKLTVIGCPCTNKKLHRKFQCPELGKTGGIFSLIQGRHMLDVFASQGIVNPAEKADADAALVAAGLPEFPEFSPAELDKIAAEYAEEGSLAAEMNVARSLEEGLFTPAYAAYLREKIGACIGAMALAN